MLLEPFYVHFDKNHLISLINACVLVFTRLCNAMGVSRQNGAFWGGYTCTIDLKPRPTIHASKQKQPDCKLLDPPVKCPHGSVYDYSDLNSMIDLPSAGLRCTV